jgi:hypothetical protein
MAINQNIQTFYKTAQNRDFSRDFLFRVTQMVGVGLPTLNDDDFVYIKAAKLPGRVIENVNASYMGLKFNIPGSVTYEGSDSYDIEFYLDAVSNDLRLRFEAASRQIFDDAVSTGQYNTPGFENLIQLVQLNKDLTPLGPDNVYTLVGAQLRKIDSIEYKIAEGKGDVMTMKATMAYHYYVVGAGL